MGAFPSIPPSLPEPQSAYATELWRNQQIVSARLPNIAVTILGEEGREGSSQPASVYAHRYRKARAAIIRCGHVGFR